MFFSNQNHRFQFLAGGILAGITLTSLNSCNLGTPKEENLPEKPNIVILYGDDVGYGDLGCYGAKGVETPNLDYMAKNGVLFTDAHSAAATCTPSRYSLLTGNYAFRMQAGILPGDAPLFIPPGTPTLASALQGAGYKTAVIGKWHLGLGDGNVNWNEAVKPGPLEIGFDYSFIIPATNDRVPSVYLENHHVVGLDPNNPLEIAFTDDATDPNPFDNPTGITHPKMVRQQGDVQHSGVIVNGVPRIGFMGGSEQAWWRDEDFPYILTDKAIDFFDQTEDDPFFMFFAFNEIHVPRIPDEKFIGKSTMGVRGDAIVQMDWMAGKIMDALKERGLLENTLIIFSSDNGPVLNDGYEDQAVELLGDHQPAGPFRGGKYSIYEGGNRMPTISFWPGVIPQGKTNDALWTQTDLFASLAELSGYQIEEEAAKDSENMLDVILGRSEEGRGILVQEASTYAVRKGDWKYIMPSAGDANWIEEIKNIEGGISPDHQLYNLSLDPGEQNNLARQYPVKVEELQQILDSIMQP